MNENWIELKEEYVTTTELPEGVYAGLDEVGVSSIAGAIVCSIVILPISHQIERLPIDSKLLSENSITDLAKQIMDKSLYYAIFAISPDVLDEKVDEKGMLAVQKDMWKKAIMLVKKHYPTISVILDGRHGVDLKNVKPIVGADNIYDNVSASAILSKYWCDENIRQISKQLPGYLLEKHKGYPTKAHLEAIRKFGLTSFHRPKMTAKILNKKEKIREYNLEDLQMALRQTGQLLSHDKTLANESTIPFLRKMWVTVIKQKTLPSVKQQQFVMSLCKKVQKNYKRKEKALSK